MRNSATIVACLAWSGVASVQAEAPGDVLALQGDAEYGEYLSGTCLTCHRADGVSEGIPRITGWNEKKFVRAMHAYQKGARKHDVMQLIAGRLNNEEIAALAAYFAGLD